MDPAAKSPVNTGAIGCADVEIFVSVTVCSALRVPVVIMVPKVSEGGIAIMSGSMVPLNCTERAMLPFPRTTLSKP